ncbi:hypothetical protein P7C71_g5052, partial [Lecanoromycetidae sp. Uapishka_2]
MAENKPEEQTLKTYKGNCHCGAFRYSVKLPPLESVYSCNCSFCSKKGILWAMPSSNDLFVVERGEGTLRDYEFSKKTMTHKVRSLHDIDLDALKITPMDGEKLEPAYQTPTSPKPSNPDTSLKTYDGSCHCGKVTYAFQSLPLEEIETMECNCASCTKNATLWVYPTKDAVTVAGAENLTHWSRYYKDKPEENAGNGFCSTCGVSVLNKIGSALSSRAHIQPINVRTINGVDLSVLKIKKGDGKGWGEPYVLDEI